MEFPDFQTRAVVVADEDGEEVQMIYLDNHLSSAAPTLLLFHGLFDNKATWILLGRELREDCRLVAPDLVGFGYSSKPLLGHHPEAYRYSPAMQIDYLERFIGRLGLEELILVGNSLGGGLALQLYLTRKELVDRLRGLILIDAAAYPQQLPGYVRELGGWLGALLNTPLGRFVCFRLGLAELLVRRTFSRTFCDQRKIPAALVQEALAVMRTPNAFYAYRLAARNLVPPNHPVLVSRLREVTCPVLILWGWEDRIISPLNALRFQQDIPHARLHIFDQCGHAPHLEYPCEVANLIREWLQEHFPSCVRRS